MNIEVGDVCEIVHGDVKEANGCIVKITGPEDWYYCGHRQGPFFGFCIEPIKLSDGGTALYVVRRCLRKIEPPADDFTAGDWDLIPWRPAKESVE